MDFELNERGEELLEAVLDYMRKPPKDNLTVQILDGTKYYFIDYKELAHQFHDFGWTEFDVEIMLRWFVHHKILECAVSKDKTIKVRYRLTEDGIALIVKRGMI